MLKFAEPIMKNERSERQLKIAVADFSAAMVYHSGFNQCEQTTTSILHC